MASASGWVHVMGRCAAGRDALPGACAAARLVEVSRECLGDACAVAGGQEVEQQAADDGHGEPGVGTGRWSGRLSGLHQLGAIIMIHGSTAVWRSRSVPGCPCRGVAA